MIVLQILKSKEMKKIAFMFAAAAMFVACANTQNKPAAEEVEAPVEPVEEVAEAIDSAAVWALVGDTVGLAADSIEAKFQAALAEMQAQAAAAIDQVGDAVEGAVDQAADAVENAIN